MKRFFPFIFIFLFAIYATVPLFQPGYIPTHDGEFSIIRLWQFTKMLQAGFLVPRWAPDLNSGYGVPLFIFYYPLPYYIGSLIYMIGFSLVDSFKMTLAISYLGAIIFCFLWLRKLFNENSAIVGTLLFLSVPYWFVDIYVRGSVGEVMAVFWCVASFAAIEYKKPRLLALAVAGLVVSHNIAAAMFLPVIAVYILLRRRQLFLSLLWGLGISIFFWLPPIVEQKFVLGLSNFDYRDHFPQLAQLLIPSWGTGFSQPGWPASEMSQQVGVGVLATLVLSIVLVKKETNTNYKRLIVSSLGLAVVALYLMLAVSLPLWQIFTPMRFIQYPWRLLSYFILITGLLGGYISKLGQRISVILVGGSLLLVLPYMRPVVYKPRSDAYYLSRSEFTDGTTTVGNSFSTIWSSWKPNRPTTKFEVVSGEALISNVKGRPTQYEFVTNSATPSRIRANIAFYPGWELAIDQKGKSAEEHEGVIYFSLEPGIHKISLQFRETPLRKASDIVAFLSLFWLIGSAILGQDYAHRHRRFTTSNRT